MTAAVFARCVGSVPRFIALVLVPIAFIAMKMTPMSMGGESGVLLSFPISQEFVHPGTFPATDLLTFYGVKTPFYFYKWSGYFAEFLPLPNLYSLLSVVVVFLQAWGIWWIADAFTPDKGLRALAVGILMLTDYFTGTIHFFAFPNPGIGSLTAALPFGFAAIALALRRRYAWSAAALGLGLFMHPGATICAGVVTLAAAWWDEKSRRRALVTVLAVSGIFAALFFLDYAAQTKAQFSADLIRLFHVWQIHSHFEKHLEDGYASFALTIAAAIHFARFIPMSDHLRRTVFWSIAAWIVLPMLYSIDLYTIFYPHEFLQLYLFRTAIFLKIFCYILIVVGMVAFCRSPAISPLTRASVMLVGGAVLISTFSDPFTEASVQRTLLVWLSLLFVLSVERDKGKADSRSQEAEMPAPPLVTAAAILVGAAVLLNVPSPRYGLVWILLIPGLGMSLWRGISEGTIGRRFLVSTLGLAFIAIALALAAAVATNAVALAPFRIVDIETALAHPGLDRLRFLNLLGVSIAVVWLLFERFRRTGPSSPPRPAGEPAPPELSRAGRNWSLAAMAIAATIASYHGFTTRPLSRAFVMEALGAPAQPRPHLTKLVAWLVAETPKASMILADPVATRPLALRYLARRGLWISTTEFNQYSYHFAAYREAARRLEGLGVRIKPDRAFDYVFSNGFRQMAPEQLFDYARREKIDYILIDRQTDHREFGRPPMYEDTFYAVYSVTG